MRKLSAGLAATALVLAGAAYAGPAVPAAGPTGGGITSDNVEWIRHIAFAPGATGGRVVGKYFYMNDQQKIIIFDISTPDNPTVAGILPMPQEFLLSREDLDTNGKIMIVPNTVTASADGNPSPSTSALYVVDVEDKSNPTIIGKAVGGGSHTSSCVLDCKWAWNSDGRIIDLRDPTNPTIIEEKWGDGMPATGAHDVNEVAPGIVLTSSNPMMLLDARKDPTHPKLLAVGADVKVPGVWHSNDWPQNGKDRFIMLGTESNVKPQCSESNGGVMLWDSSGWQKTRSFELVDQYWVKNGTYVDGNPAVDLSCSSHWLEAHPKFRNGGIVAAAFFEHGSRFLNITPKGQIEEAGWFVPYAGSTSATYWINNEIVYAVDYQRGIDVLKWNGK